MPFGRESTGDHHRDAQRTGGDHPVTNAFRQGVHWGLSEYLEIQHKLDEWSPMPFGRESTGD